MVNGTKWVARFEQLENKIGNRVDRNCHILFQFMCENCCHSFAHVQLEVSRISLFTLFALELLS
jgi:hypothetical protein